MGGRKRERDRAGQEQRFDVRKRRRIDQDCAIPILPKDGDHALEWSLCRICRNALELGGYQEPGDADTTFTVCVSNPGSVRLYFWYTPCGSANVWVTNRRLGTALPRPSCAAIGYALALPRALDNVPLTPGRKGGSRRIERSGGG